MSLPSSSPPLAAHLTKHEALDDDATISAHRSSSAHEVNHSVSEKRSSKADSVDLGSKELSSSKAEAEVGVDDAGGNAPEDDYPDGGFRAWLIVFGGMCNTFSTFGYVNSWGVFQGYYQQTILRDTSPSSIAWIGSLQYSLIFFPSLIVGRLFDLGYTRSIFLSSSALLVLSTFLTAECKVYWQFLLCQGVAVGLAAGGIFGPTTAVIAHWFKKRRGIAMGFVAIGSSLGGTLLPIATKNLLPRVGFKWTIRIIGFILIFTVGLANVILKRRLPPKHVSGGLLNLKAFKSMAYTTYCLSSLVTFLGLYTVLTYVGVSATKIGISEDFSFYFIAFGNASSLFGRYTGGYLCDRIGPMNVMIPFTAAAGILTYAWPFAKSEGSLIAVTLIYGFCSGAYVSLLSNPMMDFGDIADVGRRIGMYMSILALGALAGPPISGQINIVSGGFEAVGIYAGTCVLVGVALMCVSRHLVLRRLIGKL